MAPGKKGLNTKDIERNFRRKLHKTLQNVTRDFKQFEFNTIVSGLMELINDMIDFKDSGGWNTETWNEAVDIYLRIMAPITPHVAEELWERTGKTYSIHMQKWPKVDDSATIEDIITLIIQINGKLRDRVDVSADISENEAKEIALSREQVQKFLAGKKPQKVIYVPGRLVSIVL